MKTQTCSDELLYRRERQLASLSQQSEIALLASLVCALLLSVLMYESAPIENIVRWGQLMAAVGAIRYFLIYAYRDVKVEPQHVQRWRLAFIGTLCASGLAWGSASFFLAPSSVSVDQAIVILFILGSIAGVSSIFMLDRLGFGAFAACALAVPITNLLLLGDTYSTKYAGVLILFAVFLLFTSTRGDKYLQSEYELQAERERLTEQLAEDKEQIKSLAEELELRVNERTNQLTELNERLQAEVFERREAEQQAKVQRSRFVAAFEHAPIGMLIVHAATGSIVRANRALSDMLGYDNDSLTSMRLPSLLCPTERQRGKGGCLFAGNEVVERRYLDRHGHIVWGRTSCGTMSGDDLGDEHIVVQIEDLTDLKSARDALSARGGALEMAFDAAPTATAVLDSCGRFTCANRSMRELFDLDGEDINRTTMTTILDLDEDPEAIEDLSSLFAGDAGFVEFVIELNRGEFDARNLRVEVRRVENYRLDSAYAVVHVSDVSEHRNEPAETGGNVVPLPRLA